jgi:hypothetical protein
LAFLFAGNNLTSIGSLNIWIDGSSLCDGTNNCGYVLFNGEPPLQYLVWNQKQIKVSVRDPADDSTPNTVQVPRAYLVALFS